METITCDPDSLLIMLDGMIQAKASPSPAFLEYIEGRTIQFRNVAALLIDRSQKIEHAVSILREYQTTHKTPETEETLNGDNPHQSL